jgi:branched-chain amino acid transport system permease protein
MLSGYVESQLIFLGVNILMAFSVYLPHTAGLISLGQGGFMAIGAFTSALLTQAGVPFPAALGAGALLAAITGALVSAPAIRIRGIYLIIATLGFGEIVRVFFLNFEPTGAAYGMPGIQPHTTLAWVGGCCVVIGLILWRMRALPIGRASVAVHEDEDAAEAMGIHLFRTKLFAFSGGALIAGLAGALYAHYAQFIDPAQFGFIRSADAFLFVVLGGAANPLGSVIGATVVSLVPEALRALSGALPESMSSFHPENWRMSLFAVLLIACAIWRPGGLVSWKAKNRR